MTMGQDQGHSETRNKQQDSNIGVCTDCGTHLAFTPEDLEDTADTMSSQGEERQSSKENDTEEYN